jgi:hypothetical protein
MQLARAAAARTLIKWAEPEQPPAAEPPSTPAAEPQSHPETASHANPVPTRRAPNHAAGTATPKQIDPAILFTRLAAIVRDCVALEARLSATTCDAPRAASRPRWVDPRRAHLREALVFVTEHNLYVTKTYPDRADLVRNIDTSIDAALTCDTEQSFRPGALLIAISKQLGFEVDFAARPDKYLPAYADMLDIDAALSRASRPRATSPP